MTDKSLKDKAINIKGSKYPLVKDRVLYFNENYPNGSINPELISAPTSEMVIVKSTVIPDCNKPERQFSDYSQAIIGDGMVNKTAALENASTSATGRALAMMGIGVIESIASADEMNKAIGSTGDKLATPKQIDWMRGVAAKAMGETDIEGMGAEIDDWIEHHLSARPENIPIYKVKEIVDKITEIGQEIKDMQPKSDIDISQISMSSKKIKKGMNDGSIPY